MPSVLSKGAFSWKITADDKLALIAKFAIEGLDKIETMYKANPKYTSVPTLISCNKKILQDWIDGTSAQVVLTADETTFVEKIKAIWSKELIDSFYNLYIKGECAPLEALIDSKRTTYHTELAKEKL